MPLRCVEFSGYIGALGAILVMSIMLWIASFAIAPLGKGGEFIIKCLRITLSLYGGYMFINMLATVIGLRGKCPQGYRTGWPPIRGSTYTRDAEGKRHDD